MIRYENECVGCSSTGLPCLGDGCPNRRVLHCYCDECEAELDDDDIYDVDGDMLCDECALKRMRAPYERWL